MKVAILDGCDLDVRIPEDRSNFCIVTAEHLGCWNGVSSVTYSDLRTDREKLQQSLHARRCAGGAVDVHEVSAVGVIYHRHQRSQSARMVAVGMRDEDVVDIAEVRPQPGKTASDTVTSIYDILAAIDHKQI